MEYTDRSLKMRVGWFMQFSLRSADTTYPRPISDSRLLAVLKLAFVNGWKCERDAGGNTEESALAEYLAPVLVSVSDAGNLADALSRVELDLAWEPSPELKNDTQKIRQMAAGGEFQIEVVSEDLIQTVANNGVN